MSLGEWHPPVAPPISLTQNIPDPATVQRQKEGYVRNLDDQLRQGAVVLDGEHKQRRDAMNQAADTQKKQFAQQIDQQVKMQEMDLDHQFLQVLQYVKQQATRQRAQLEQQAMQLSFEYQEKKVEEDMMSHQFELTKHQQVLKTQMGLQQPLSPLPSYLPPATSCTLQVPTNPYASLQLAALAADSLAPTLSAVPFATGGAAALGGYTSSSYVPPQATSMPTATFSAPVTAYSTRTPSYRPAPVIAMAAPTTATFTRTPSYQPPVTNAYVTAPVTNTYVSAATTNAYAVRPAMTPTQSPLPAYR